MGKVEKIPKNIKYLAKIQLLSVKNAVKASIIRRIKAEKYQNSLKIPPYYRPKKSKSGR